MSLSRTEQLRRRGTLRFPIMPDKMRRSLIRRIICRLNYLTFIQDSKFAASPQSGRAA
jgi:hypothetical protein